MYNLIIVALVSKPPFLLKCGFYFWFVCVEDIETSLSDYQKALSILERLVEPDSRLIAELYPFKGLIASSIWDDEYHLLLTSFFIWQVLKCFFFLLNQSIIPNLEILWSVFSITS